MIPRIHLLLESIPEECLNLDDEELLDRFEINRVEGALLGNNAKGLLNRWLREGCSLSNWHVVYTSAEFNGYQSAIVPFVKDPWNPPWKLMPKSI